MTMPMMLAFLIDQVQQLCCKVYQKARQHVNTSARCVVYLRKYGIALILVCGKAGIICILLLATQALDHLRLEVGG